MLKSARLGCLGFGIALLLAEAALAHYPGESHSPNGASGTGRSFLGIGGVGGGSGIVGNSAVQNSQPGLGSQKYMVPGARNVSQSIKDAKCIDPRIVNGDSWDCNSAGNPGTDSCDKAPPLAVGHLSELSGWCDVSNFVVWNGGWLQFGFLWKL